MMRSEKRPKIKDRVGAIRKLAGGRIVLFGYGKYIGNEIPPKDAAGAHMTVPCPVVLLDNDETIYGNECLIGSEEKVRQQVANASEVLEWKIEVYRAAMMFKTKTSRGGFL